MDNELIKSCSSCLSVRPNPPKASLIPCRVWSRVHVDYAGLLNQNYFLIVTDAYSKWPEVFRTRDITSSFTINNLREIFATFGLPDTIVSDNGTQFTASSFKNFVKLNKIEHITTASGHPTTNGAAENAVRSFKNGLKSTIADGKTTDVDILTQRYLLDQRVTEHCSTGEAPAKTMFNRNLRTRLNFCQPPTIEHNLLNTQNNQVAKGKRDVSFEVNEPVSIRDFRDPTPNTNKWMPATVKRILGPRSYLCQGRDGSAVFHRHLNQMHKCNQLARLELKTDANTEETKSLAEGTESLKLN